MGLQDASMQSINHEEDSTVNHNFKWVASVSMAAVSSLIIGGEAIAQETRQVIDADKFPLVQETLAERMEEVFYTNDQPYYVNRGIPRQISSFIGASFIENEINEDARLIHEFATQMWEEQTSSTPVVRTPDLPNPYQSSLLLEPTIAQQEFPATFVRQPIGAPPTVVRTTPRQPVQALW